MTPAVKHLQKAVVDERETLFNVLAANLYVKCFVAAPGLSADDFEVSRRDICDLDFILGIAWDDTRYPITRIIAAEAAGCIKYVDECYCESFDLFRLAHSLANNLLDQKPTSAEIIYFKIDDTEATQDIEFVEEPTLSLSMEYYGHCDGNIGILEPHAEASRSRIRSRMSDLMARVQRNSAENSTSHLRKIVTIMVEKDGLAFLNSDTPLYMKFFKRIERSISNPLSQRITAIFCRAVLFFRLRDFENSARKFRQLVPMTDNWTPETKIESCFATTSALFLNFFGEPESFKEATPPQQRKNLNQNILSKENLVPTRKSRDPTNTFKWRKIQSNSCFNCDLASILNPFQCLEISWPKHRNSCKNRHNIKIGDHVFVHSLINHSYWNGSFRKVVGQGPNEKWMVQDEFGNTILAKAENLAST
ncbi:hypothetical protein HK100_005626, partial [Physocladia obscura]